MIFLARLPRALITLAVQSLPRGLLEQSGVWASLRIFDIPTICISQPKPVKTKLWE